MNNDFKGGDLGVICCCTIYPDIFMEVLTENTKNRSRNDCYPGRDLNFEPGTCLIW